MEKLLDGIQETRIIGRTQKTIVTHNAVSIGASTYADSAYFDALGFDKIAITLKNNASTNSTVDIFWSHDGTTREGYETIIASSTVNEKVGIIDTKARYFCLRITNGDGSAHTMTAHALLKA